MAYTHITLSDARQQLSYRLHDSTNQFWTNTGAYPELDLYLFEALRTWQVLTSYWRERGTLSTTANTTFYDIPTNLSGSLRNYTLQDRDLVAVIQAHFLEPVTGLSYAGSEMFTLPDFTDSLQRRRNQFIAETGCRVVRTTQALQAPPIARQPLPDSTVDVRRVALQDVDGKWSLLWRDDEWALNAYNPSWTTSYERPYIYSI